MGSLLSVTVESGMCIGCGACGVVAPSKVVFHPNSAGFVEPLEVSALSPDETRTVERVCPALNVEGPEQANGLWGPIVEVLRGHAVDPELRYRASSGGALSAVSIGQLAGGLADEVICVRASEVDPLSTLPFATSSVVEVAEASGSRYAPASPILALPAPAGRERRVVFVGKPCDVAAARGLEREGRLGETEVSLYVSFLCAGTPSAGGTNEVLRAMGVSPDDVVSFRYRGNGWPGAATATTGRGESQTLDYDVSWGQHLGRCIHERCKYCGDGIGLSADLVFGDAWMLGANGLPTFEEHPGESLVLVRTERGHQAVSLSESLGKLAVEPLDLSQVSLMQPYQVHRRRYVRARLLGRRMAGGRVPRYGRSCGVKLLQRGSHPIRALREAFGAFRRSR